jgi:hypothetical protein
MKNTLLVLLSGSLLLGCSTKQAASSPRQAIDLVKSGTFTKWDRGYVMHVTKRDGTSLEGIELIDTSPGSMRVFTADTGTIMPGQDNPIFTAYIKLYNTRMRDGTGSPEKLGNGNFRIELFVAR